jgi:hypothetical protein
MNTGSDKNTVDDKDLLSELKEPFESTFVKWRIGATNKEKTKAIPLAFIDGREVMKRLDQVCGVTGWQNRYSHVTEQGVVCEIGIKANGEWLWKANGAGETDVEAEKGAMTDAFKRAAALWGIGRYLYYLPTTWVDIEPAGKSYKFKTTPKLPIWALPKAK